MIAKGKILQMAAAAFAAYAFFTLIVKYMGDETWPNSLSHSPRNFIHNSAFEHIQNRTLGVSSHLPSRF